MFESIGKIKSGPLKALTLFAIGLLVSVGLCGVGGVLGGVGGPAAAGLFAGLGAILFVISLPGTILSALWLLVSKIREAFRE